jgi:hypothetical protein
MTGAETTLARFYARQAIKRELLGQGLKLSHVEPSEITAAANVYLSQHREELITKACATLSTFAQKTKALIGKGFRCANVMCVIAAHVPPCVRHMIGNQRKA